MNNEPTVSPSVESTEEFDRLISAIELNDNVGLFISEEEAGKYMVTVCSIVPDPSMVFYGRKNVPSIQIPLPSLLNAISACIARLKEVRSEA